MHYARHIKVHYACHITMIWTVPHSRFSHVYNINIIIHVYTVFGVYKPSILGFFLYSSPLGLCTFNLILSLPRSTRAGTITFSAFDANLYIRQRRVAVLLSFNHLARQLVCRSILVIYWGSQICRQALRQWFWMVWISFTSVSGPPSITMSPYSSTGRIMVLYNNRPNSGSMYLHKLRRLYNFWLPDVIILLQWCRYITCNPSALA